jgi:hypothetical protein
MRKGILACLFFLVFLGSQRTIRAQDQEIQQLLLNVEKLDQLREMLDQMKDKYQILTQGYDRVKSLTEGNFKLHEVFLDRLVRVNPKVKSYYRVAQIVEMQLLLAKGIGEMKKDFSLRDLVSGSDLNFLREVYGSFGKSSLRNLEELLLILSDNQLQMDDAERIHAIDRIHLDMQNLFHGFGKFSLEADQLLELRAYRNKDTQTLNQILSNE